MNSLNSLIKAIKEYKGEISLHIIYDGKPANKDLVKLARSAGTFEVINLENNSGSFRYAYQLALKFDKEDIVYFVEDDYFHLPAAIKELKFAFDNICPDYLTLYDHPVRYAEDYKFGLDLPTKTEIFFAGNHHWRHQESTCMTFASKVETLQEDKELFWRYTNQEVPEDRELFRRLLGLTGYEKGSPCRSLIGPMPSLATHLHVPWLAPGIDWEYESKK
jgi:hypothetical protein